MDSETYFKSLPFIFFVTTTFTMAEPHYLFVYGWLKTEHQHRLPFSMPRKLIGKAWVSGGLYYVAEYPGIRLDETGQVWGELYEVPDEYDWTDMDEYEYALPTVTENAEYQRIQTQAHIDGTSYYCWIYEYLHPLSKDKCIDSGEF